MSSFPHQEAGALAETLALCGNEVAACASDLQQIELVFERHIGAVSAEERRAVQDIDRVMQTLEDLAGWLNRLAAGLPGGCTVVDLGPAHAGLRLGALRARLGGVTHPGEEVPRLPELF